MKNFEYPIAVEWTGNDGLGTSNSRFGRDSEISTSNKPTLIGSAPREFGGDGTNWSPEDLFVAAVSQCHMLTYLHLCSRNGIVVDSYRDDAVGRHDVDGAAGGQFRCVELRPNVTISAGDPAAADALHAEASNGCFVGRSVSSPITVKATTTIAAAGS